jgi:hypothetical protein
MPKGSLSESILLWNFMAPGVASTASLSENNLKCSRRAEETRPIVPAYFFLAEPLSEASRPILIR